MKLQFLPLFDTQEVKDYPYGFKLRTTLYIHIEYKKGKGFRVGRTTINPKNGKRNATKYSTYHKFARLYIDEKTGYVESYVTDVKDLERYNLALDRGAFDDVPKEIFDAEKEIVSNLFTSIRWMTSFQGWTVNGVFDEETRRKPPELTIEESQTIKDEIDSTKSLSLHTLLPIYKRIEKEYEENGKKI